MRRVSVCVDEWTSTKQGGVMSRCFVPLDVSQSEISWLKKYALSNIEAIVSTLEVSSNVIGELKASAFMNMLEDSRK